MLVLNSILGIFKPKGITPFCVITFILLSHKISGNPREVFLKWKACVEQAVSYNQELKAARLNVEQSELAYQNAYALYGPTLTLNGNVGYASHTGNASGQAGLNLAQPLFPSLFEQPDLQKAYFQLKAQQATYQDTVSRVGFEVKSTFVELQYHHDLLVLMRSLLERRQKNLDLIQYRFEAGKEHKGAYLRAKAQYEQILSDVDKTRRLLTDYRLKLERLIGTSIPEKSEVTGTILTEELNQEILISDQANHHPEIQKAFFTYESSKAAYKARQLESWPKVNGVLSADSSIGASSGTASLKGVLSFSFSLWDGNKQERENHIARLEEERLYQLYLDARNKKRIAIQQSRTEYQNAIQDVKTQKFFTEAASIRAEIAQAQYANGLLSYENWDIIENDFISQQRGLLTKERDLTLAYAQWERSSGRSFE